MRNNTIKCNASVDLVVNYGGMGPETLLSVTLVGRDKNGVFNQTLWTIADDKRRDVIPPDVRLIVDSIKVCDVCLRNNFTLPYERNMKTIRAAAILLAARIRAGSKP